MDLHPGPEKRRVTGGKLAELEAIRRALQENEDWYQDIVEHGQDLLCVHDLKGRLLLVNPAPARVLGYDVEELLQIPMRELIAPEFRSEFESYLSHVARAGEARGSLAVMTRSGERRIWEYHNTLRTEGAAPPIVRGLAHDVTEQRRVEKLLRKAGEELLVKVREHEQTIRELKLFRTLVDQCNDAIEVVDPETLRFLDVNEQACSALGYTREELLSLTVFDIDPHVAGSSIKSIRERWRKPGWLVLESLHRRKDGSIFPVEVSTRQVQLERDYIVAIARDLTDRKSAEARLREYERVVEGLDEMILVVNRERRYVLVNAAYLSYRGRTHDEVVGHLLPQVLGQELYEAEIREKVDECFRGKAVSYETRRKRGMEERDLSVKFLPIQGAEGIDRMAIILRDVTVRKRAEEALRETEARFRTLYEQSPVGICLVETGTGRFLGVNPKYCEITGRTEQDLLSRDFQSITHPDDLAENCEKLRQLARGDLRKYEMEKRYVRPDGCIRWAEVQVVSVGAEGKTPVWHMAIVQDITERRQAEERLREYERVVEGLDELIAVVDREYRYVITNRAFLKYSGTTKEQVIGRRIDEVVNPGTFAIIIKQKVDECFAGKTVRHEMKYQYPGLGERDIFVSYLLVEGPAGADRIACVIQDITERKRAEEAIRESEDRERAKSKELETVLETVPVPVFIAHDIGCMNITTNRAGYEKLRLPAGTNISQSRPPEERAHVRFLREGKELSADQLPMRLTAATGSPLSGVPLTLALADGTERHLQFNAAPLLDGDGTLIGVVGAAMDVTERKRAEDALQEREKTLRLILDHLAVGVILSSVGEERAIYQNPRFLELFGYSIEQHPTVADWWLVAYPDPVYREWVSQQWRRRMNEAARKKGTIEPMEVNITCPDGSTKYVRVLAKVIGELNFVTFVDLSERKQAEEALRRGQENYRMFISQSSEGIFRQDMDAPVAIDLPEDELVHHILHDSYMAECNDAIARMYGMTSGEEFVGKRLTELLSPVDPRNIELTREYIRSGFRVLDRESHEVDIYGNPKVFLNSMIGIVENGMLVRTWGIQRDITEKVSLEESRRAADEALRQSEQRFRIALEGSPITVFNQDRDLRYTWVYNPQEGWSEADYLGKTDEEIFGPEVGGRMTALKRPVLETGRATRQEFSLTARGKTYHCDSTVEPLRDAAGAIVGVNCACMDVTHLREVTEELGLAKEKLSEEKLYLEQAIDAELGFGEIIGRSGALKEVMDKVARVAPSEATVLLLGETGTGKELVARALHRLSRRQANSFIKLNCAAIPSGLLESELFGHEKGAFTGAVAKKLGRLELADEGTLFLDEIGEIPLELQPKLLRVLQDQEFERLGGTQTLKVHFRLLAASNRDLLQSVKQRDFRSDLYYRLNVFPIHLPPLRERREDIRLLVEHFVRKYSHRMNKSILSIPTKTMEALVRWEWPGNIRELENFVERSVILTPGSVLQAPLGELHAPTEEVHGVTLREKERERILRALRECHGKIGGPNGAAASLGLKRTTLQSKLSQLGIKPQTFQQ